MDKLRVRMATVVTCVWVASFGVSVFVKSYNPAYVHAIMLVVAGGLFAAPAFRKDKDG